MSKLIVGCGYLGARVAEAWSSKGHLVHAVTRSAERAAHFAERGWKPLRFDVTSQQSIPQLPPVDTVLFAVGYGRSKQGEDDESRPSIFEVYVNGLKNVLAALPDTVQRFIYISSTGVFSQNDGSWVTEEAVTEPIREGGKACLAAEELLKNDKLGRCATILRLAGIYGPNRVPRKADIVAGNPIASPEQGYLNLIHVDDAVATVLAAEKNANTYLLPRTYLVSDGSPCPRCEYYVELARLLNAPVPTFETPNADSHVAARASADKRIDSRRMRNELAPKISFPSYREGLRAILAAE